jgi:uncharacterized protein YbbC (DUF1343 family)
MKPVFSSNPLFFLWFFSALFSSFLFSHPSFVKNAEPDYLKALPIQVGAEQIHEYLPLLRKKKVGLLVNQTSYIRKKHLLDVLIEQNIDVILLFSPEHGIRGKKAAGESVHHMLDPQTKIPIISLYGQHKRPQKKYLKKIDILLFDIQDVGVRFYTYISTMHYLMESCAEEQIPLIILDRPNPNGDYIAGPILKTQWKSFVGMHSIPVVHGLTVGELALMIQGEGWLNTEKTCPLIVIKNKHYHHGRHYSLPISPSPNLPNDNSVRLYPSLGFFEATSVSVGRGTLWPFQVLGYPNKKMGSFRFKPKKIKGSWSRLNYADKVLYGEKIPFTKSASSSNPTIGLSSKMTLRFFMEWRHRLNQENRPFIMRPAFLSQLSGSDQWKYWLKDGKTFQQIEASWKKDLLRYQEIRKRYLLYDDSHYMKSFR